MIITVIVAVWLGLCAFAVLVVKGGADGERARKRRKAAEVDKALHDMTETGDHSEPDHPASRR